MSFISVSYQEITCVGAKQIHSKGDTFFVDNLQGWLNAFMCRKMDEIAISFLLKQMFIT